MCLPGTAVPCCNPRASSRVATPWWLMRRATSDQIRCPALSACPPPLVSGAARLTLHPLVAALRTQLSGPSFVSRWCESAVHLVIRLGDTRPSSASVGRRKVYLFTTVASIASPPASCSSTAVVVGRQGLVGHTRSLRDSYQPRGRRETLQRSFASGSHVPYFAPSDRFVLVSVSRAATGGYLACAPSSLSCIVSRIVGRCLIGGCVGQFMACIRWSAVSFDRQGRCPGADAGESAASTSPRGCARNLLNRRGLPMRSLRPAQRTNLRAAGAGR